MKNLTTLLAVGFLAVLTSCSTTKQTADASSVSSETNRGRSNQTIERTKTENTPKFSSDRSSSSDNANISDNIKNTEATDMARMEEMYSSLDMNKEQITRYEKEWKSSIGAWKRSNRGKTMNSFERTEYQDRIMKNILNETQFETYQKWARENPITD